MPKNKNDFYLYTSKLWENKGFIIHYFIYFYIFSIPSFIIKS